MLPIHTSGHHADSPDSLHRAVMDRVVSSYTPTITTLRHTRQHSDRGQPPAGDERALIVAMPVMPGVGYLPQARAEATLVAAHLPGAIQLIRRPGDTTVSAATGPRAADGTAQAAPTKASVLAHLAGCATAHFACHGASDPTDPSRSRLLLQDHRHNPLTVASLTALNLEHARLAYLSACSTALNQQFQLLDEAIHLAAAFQMAGFPHVVATLWTISDECAPALADAFYTNLADGAAALDTGRAAYALHHAVQDLRRRLPLSPSLWAAYLHAGA
ncbi:CHAT domain-containing protein [Acrocarpospora sp. B8E8]|uniref:CHAT domain-containing protein n=1 Tax=Acrocarpospora sp. B8E8 TaxID=3153572 RepID=UPI00325E6885